MSKESGEPKKDFNDMDIYDDMPLGEHPPGDIPVSTVTTYGRNSDLRETNVNTFLLKNLGLARAIIFKGLHISTRPLSSPLKTEVIISKTQGEEDLTIKENPIGSLKKFGENHKAVLIYGGIAFAVTTTLVGVLYYWWNNKPEEEKTPDQEKIIDNLSLDISEIDNPTAAVLVGSRETAGLVGGGKKFLALVEAVRNHLVWPGSPYEEAVSTLEGIATTMAHEDKSETIFSNDSSSPET